MSSFIHGSELTPYEALWVLRYSIKACQLRGTENSVEAERRVLITEISCLFDNAGCPYELFDGPAWKYVYTGEKKFLIELEELGKQFGLQEIL